ncbi:MULTISPECIES: mechanosensitive ion channel family protein [Thermoactinomyces]|jgi:moderate conductance mechanosensitive channel|uniref:Mechanosensitive ion channel family protein n=1 Tax=Thermoactinomyces vulgaris TaxID=2026 RepID=A0ABS0QK50_THEVU|nr:MULTISPECIES: mechanosensitive ion channel family protein [Thermoactinomyces]MBA4552504.1 mechanosensitive ion channel family protein [Thermoactinomyces vulgaris]MBA4597674.1 mechanosensitive ion channel family protein [Thermoactinomyces vulgaris]MBH8584554.1 mechanosensitive ion channel family protein [Thermoactinomyces sp. CICC 10735]MBH8587001.1 mechanosensitive ion channel family protein [Thermoactinomyces sp. CICC 10520]MBH8589650.1 mechanosensitive ion channel family protein [Thermoac
MNGITEQTLNTQIAAAGELAVQTKTLLTRMIEDPMSYIVLPAGQIALIVVLTIVALRFVDRIVDKIFDISRMESKKAQTLRKLIKSIARYAIYFISALTILINLGFDPLPVLAGAGVLGLAVGFGAQNLIRDVISGFFMIFEGQLEVGDYVEINGQIRGTVEEVGLRITKIREFNQRLHYLANGNINQVTNYNRDQMRAIVNVTVPYESDLSKVNEALEEVCANIQEKFASSLIQEPEIMGITTMDASGVTFTLTALSEPDQFWALERAIRKETILVLHRYKIDFAYPRSVVYHLEDGQEAKLVKEGFEV